MKKLVTNRRFSWIYAILLAVLVTTVPSLGSNVYAQTSEASQLVTWTCTGTPCNWGSPLSGHAVVWPEAMGPLNNRLGYTVSAGVYLPAQAASGLSVSLVSGSAGVYAGTPDAASHRVLTTLTAGQSYTISGVISGEVVSVQSDNGFTYTLGSNPASPTPTSSPTLVGTIEPTPVNTVEPTPDSTGQPAFDTSQLVTWTCTGTPCGWGSPLNGQAVVWPESMGPLNNRLGYTVSAGIYLPAASAAGLSFSLVSGSASMYAGLPDAASHRVLATLNPGQSYTVSGVVSGEVISVQSDNAFTYTFEVNPATITPTPDATATATATATPPCIDPMTCSTVSSVPAYWRCNYPGCAAADWLGAAVAWPEWSAYASNARSGNNSRSVYNYQDEPLHAYMGSWANGCQVTAVSGLVLIIEWQRGTDVWRETYLQAGQSHTISLVPPENGAMIETIDGVSPQVDFSVTLQNCNPQPLSQTPTPTTVPATATATAVPPTNTAVPPTATSIAPTATVPTATTVAPTSTSVAPTPTTVPPTATSVVPTPTAVPATGFPTTGVLDNFNRANGPIGNSWLGDAANYAVASGRLAVGSGEDIYWSGASYAANQEAFVTLLSIDSSGTEIGLILKAQSSSGYGAGLIDVVYDPIGHRIQVWTYSTANGWVQHGANLPVTFVNGDQFGAKANANGTIELFRNGNSLGVRDLTGWPYATNSGYIGLFNLNSANSVLDDFGGGNVGSLPGPTPTNTPLPPTATSIAPTATAVPPTSTSPAPTATVVAPTATPPATALPSGGFPITTVLDNFNRANGSIGSSWLGNTSSYSILNGQLDVGSDEDIYWSGSSFAANQEAFVTLQSIDSSGTELGLILKAQSNSGYGAGLIDVVYDPANHRVQVWTYSTANGWFQHGANIPVTFVNGDQFGARVSANGTIEIFRNGNSLGIRDLSNWPYATSSGYIGLFNLNAPNSVLENFGGGTVN